MNKHTVRAGKVVIGYIHTNEVALGDEVFVETAFPESNPDDADQCSTFALGEARLRAIYEDHLKAPKRLPPAPPVAPAVDSDDDGLPF